jgi:hypothetical protein
MTKKAHKNIHVILRNDGWVIRREGNDRLISTHNTKEEAIDAARKLARNAKSELVIHSRDGRISSRDSYGSDPLPPKEPREVLFPLQPSKTNEQKIREAVKTVIKESQGKTTNES